MIPSIEEAKAALAEHDKKCPGSHIECYGKPALERKRLAWIEEKDRLKTLLQMAQESQTSVWRDCQGNETHPTLPIANSPKKSTARINPQPQKTAVQLVKEANETIAAMATVPPGSVEWNRMRKRAQNLVAKARDRQKVGDNLDFPAVPSIPAEISKRGKAKKDPSEIINGMVATLQRYQATDQRRNASALKARIRRTCRELNVRLPIIAA